MSNATLRERAVQNAANQLVKMAHYSPENAERVLALIERVSGPGLKEQVRAVRRLLQEDAPAGRLLERALCQLNPTARERFVTDFVLNNGWGRGRARRAEVLEQEGLYPPFAFLISPSMRCNLRCTGCYAGEYQAKDDLPLEVIERVLDEGEAMGIHFVTVLGGEPFVRRDMWDVYARHQDTYFQVYTNGTTLTPPNVERLAKLGNVAVAVSIEGWEDETDARRGPGTYAAIMDAFDRLREAGVAFGFSAMVTRHNVETVCSDSFNQMLVDKGCLFGWHFMYMPVGRDPELGLMLTPDQRDYLRTHGAAHIRTMLPLFVVDFWNDAPYVGGCIAGGTQYFHINTHGDVEPCIFAHFATDNVKEKSLIECLKSPFFRAIRNRQPYDSNLLLPCMLIDHPHVFREVCAETTPLPTHPGAEALIGELAPGLDDHAQRTRAVMNPAWQQDYVAKGFVAPNGAEMQQREQAKDPAPGK